MGAAAARGRGLQNPEQAMTTLKNCWCRHCLKRFQSTGQPRFCGTRCRFESRTDRTGDCHLWLGAKRYGYGRMHVDGHHAPEKLAHRMSWEFERGPIPEGMSVLHRCDNPSCVNVKHLFLGTQADNMTDMGAKGRGAKGEKLPQAKLTASDVARIRNHDVEFPGMSQREIAIVLGVVQQSVGRAMRGNSWKHVEFTRPMRDKSTGGG
jgi:hypothetical protein